MDTASCSSVFAPGSIFQSTASFFPVVAVRVSCQADDCGNNVLAFTPQMWAIWKQDRSGYTVVCLGNRRQRNFTEEQRRGQQIHRISASTHSQPSFCPAVWLGAPLSSRHSQHQHTNDFSISTRAKIAATTAITACGEPTFPASAYGVDEPVFLSPVAVFSTF